MLVLGRGIDPLRTYTLSLAYPRGEDFPQFLYVPHGVAAKTQLAYKKIYRASCSTSNKFSGAWWTTMDFLSFYTGR